jgi:hypothetical protein
MTQVGPCVRAAEAVSSLQTDRFSRPDWLIFGPRRQDVLTTASRELY